MSRAITKRSLHEMCEDFITTREKAKELYKEADEILLDIAEECEPGELVSFRNQRGELRAYVLLDNFEGATERWGHACVRRYDIAEVPSG